MKFSVVSLVLVGSLVLAGCSEAPEEPGSGTVLVIATDPQVGPVSGVEVTLAPDDIKRTTDESGSVLFMVPPGKYFVDAKLCCVGPGTDVHHGVTVSRDETVKVELEFCLICR